jgi:PKHD-type hydroxylase
MILISQVLSTAELAELHSLANRASWVDGSVTAGDGAVSLKRNQQVDETTADGKALATRVMTALRRHPTFAAAAIPAQVTPPLINRYGPGMEYRPHVDNSLMVGGAQPLRTDLSGTLFLTDPSAYDGGELVVETEQGRQTVKLPAGDLFLYPSTRLHWVTPVSRGTRVASIFWIQSLIRDESQRVLLLNMAQSIGALEAAVPDSPQLSRLASCYQQLVQMWAQP